MLSEKSKKFVVDNYDYLNFALLKKSNHLRFGKKKQIEILVDKLTEILVSSDSNFFEKKIAESIMNLDSDNFRKLIAAVIADDEKMARSVWAVFTAKISSKEKAAAARENGKKGGRPRLAVK